MAQPRSGGTARVDLSRWETYGDPVPTRTGGIVPVVRFRNRDGVGEFERHLDSLDRINDKIFNEWWIAKIQAFRQRAIKNLPQDKEEIDADGNVRITPIADDEYDDMFTASPDEMWQVPGDVEFWESSAIDMTRSRLRSRRMCGVWLRSRRSRCRRWCPIARTGPLRVRA